MNKKILFLIMVLLSGFLSCYNDLLDTYDDSVVYNLRDRGPAGGWIFYINPNWERDGWKYLEAAPTDADNGATKQWGGHEPAGVAITGTASGIGSGKANTAIIVNFFNGLIPDYYSTTFPRTFTNPACTFDSNNNGTVAAKECTNFSVTNGGKTYSDWFLPSKDELERMCWNLRGVKNPTVYNPDVPDAATGGIGGFGTNNYWSSTEFDLNTAYQQIFSNGSQPNYAKFSSLKVRPIRAF